ncbi:MAG: carbamoyltransferase N-terminal domain-containing protein [Acidimicrobiia bacterium]
MYLSNQSKHRMLIQHHPAVGHVFVPNLRARVPNGGYFVVTNSAGFRSNVEFQDEKGDRPRILMFGDSFTAGDACGNDDRYSEQLEELLGAEVYNFGIPGSGTDQHLLTYREFARDIDADLVVLTVHLDTVRRISVSHRVSVDRATGQRILVPKPYFTLEAGDLVLHNVPVPLERPGVGDIDPRVGSSPSGPGPRVLEWIRNDTRLGRAREATRGSLRARAAAYRLGKIQPYTEYGSADNPTWKLLRRLVEEFATEVAPRPLVVVPLPSYEHYLYGASPDYRTRFAELDDPRRGIHVLDLSSRLVGLPWADRLRLSPRPGGHFGRYGNKLVAEGMADGLRRRELLPSVATAPGSPVEPRPHRSEVPHVHRRRPEGTYVLGLSCFYHNSAAALIKDGDIVSAAEEERFTRVKNDRGFPGHAANYCLEEGGISVDDLAAVVYYDNTALTFERLLHSQLAVGGAGADSWVDVMGLWVRQKLHLPQIIRSQLGFSGRVLQDLHHRSHAASAFYPSPFERAVTLTMDGVGEWATASIGVGHGRELELVKEMHFPHSLGLLYSAFTQFAGFKVNSGEYKLMGLAPYGEPKYVGLILDHLIDLKDDGSIELNLEYFDFLRHRSMTNERFEELFGGPARAPESRITRREMDLARSVQDVIEEAMLRMGRYAHSLTGERNVCLAGGVALNCVANGRLLREGPFDDVWVQPAAGDAGCALGGALDVYHSHLEGERTVAPGGRPLQRGSYWGPEYHRDEIRAFVETHGLPAEELSEPDRNRRLAEAVAEGKVVGHFAGRMEYGPRALGARSILGDARNEDMQAELNLRIKYRESFRPFAPSVLAEKASEYFELDRESPYMLIVAPVRKERRKEVPRLEMPDGDMLPVVRQVRSEIPAVTHVDYSARVQTVVRSDNPLYYDLISDVEKLTGCAVIVNTSFNVRGEPIVCTPYDAYRCFMRTEMDVLSLGDFVLTKADQPPWRERPGDLAAEDAEDAQADVAAAVEPRGMVKALRRIFDEDFLPAANRLSALGAVPMGPNPAAATTRWTDVAPLPLDRVFRFPSALDDPNPDPHWFADEMASYWQPGPVRDEMREVLVRLVEVGRRYATTEVLGQRVPHSVYVMF